MDSMVFSGPITRYRDDYHLENEDQESEDDQNLDNGPLARAFRTSIQELHGPSMDFSMVKKSVCNSKASKYITSGIPAPVLAECSTIGGYESEVPMNLEASTSHPNVRALV